MWRAAEAMGLVPGGRRRFLTHLLLFLLICQLPLRAGAVASPDATRQAAYLRLAGATGLLHSWRNDDLTASQTASLTGTWHLATASYDGRLRRLYLDGAALATDIPAAQPDVQLANLALGQTCCGEALSGTLANVAIYPYALGAGRVARHYALGEHSPAPTPTASVLQYSYDNAGRLGTVTYPDGRREGHADYDPAGRVTHISLPDGYDYYLAYNAAGQRTQLAYPNGGAQLWAYDGAGRPHDTWWAGPGVTVPFTQTATLDAAGQRTVLQDTAGSTTYGYDGAGRLTAASYPGGSTEQDSYDGLGDRTVITSTTVLSGTAVTTNSFDAAAQLNTSVVTGGQPGTTTYGYDGNGNQTGSAGPAGTTTNTFNQHDQLTHVSGPATNETFVYDGQGDRLRAYDQSTTNYQLHTLVQDLRPGAMSGLLSDGPADYAYADFGIGAAPIARMAADANQGTYLASDLLGSVRLATTPQDQTLGSGTYDAWGNAKPNTADAAGQVLLAGLQASAPFGYAGQAYDAGPGTYGMRARQYDPNTGRFQSADPQAPSQGYPVTLNPYQYAGDMVTGTTDPSGAGWVWPMTDFTSALPASPSVNYESLYSPGRGTRDYVDQSEIAGVPAGFATRTLGGGDLLDRVRSQTAASPVQTEFWVPVLNKNTICNQRTFVGDLYTAPIPNKGELLYANIVQLAGKQGQLWDIEHVEAYKGNRGNIQYGIRQRLLANANTYGFLWAPDPRCPDPRCLRQVRSAATGYRLQLGQGYPSQAFGFGPGEVTLVDTSQFGLHDAPLVRPGRIIGSGLDPYSSLVAWEQEPGVILYGRVATDLCGEQKGPIACALLGISASTEQVSAGALAYAQNPSNPWPLRLISLGGAGAYKLPDVLILGPTTALVSRESTGGEEVAALVNIGSNFVGGAVTGALLKQGLRLAGGVRDLAALQRLGAYLAANGRGIAVAGDRGGTLVANGVERSRALGRALLRLVAGGCGHCFPAGTAVATAGGATAIEALRVGDTVLAEDPATGKVESERVQAVIARPAAPLIALDLSDGSTLRVTADHPFYVDGGPGLAGAGWLLSGELRPGDRLRTADGRGVAVLRVRWNVGEARVYTLTVATDHTFFVGTARLLVHNSTCPPVRAAIDAALSSPDPDNEYVGFLANLLDTHGIDILGFQKILFKASNLAERATDFDIETSHLIVEVKNSNGAGATKQVLNALANFENINPTGKAVILVTRLAPSGFVASAVTKAGALNLRVTKGDPRSQLEFLNWVRLISNVPL